MAVVASENSAPLSAIVAIRKNPTFPGAAHNGRPCLAHAGNDRLFLRTGGTQWRGLFRRTGPGGSESLVPIRNLFALFSSLARIAYQVAISLPCAMKKGFAFSRNGNIWNRCGKNPGAWLPPSARLPSSAFCSAHCLSTKFSESFQERLGLTAKPILLPFAEAAIDVDKPSDLELAETILKQRL